MVQLQHHGQSLRDTPQTAIDQASSAQAIDAQLAELRQRLMRHARFTLRDDGTAEDIVQETLLTVFQQHASRRGDSTLTTWATAILKHKIADWYRSPERRRMVPLDRDDSSLQDGIDMLYDESGSYSDPVPVWQQPENKEEQRQMMSALEICVSRLPRQTGKVFMMREWLGFETSEICERLGVTSENCRTILHRARSSLRICMQKGWLGHGASR